MFISVEGLDASGKTTFMQMLKNRLEEMGESVQIIGKKTIEYNPDDYIGRSLLHLNPVLFEILPGDDMTRIPDDAWVYMNASWFSIVSNNYFEQEGISLSDSWIYKRIARFALLEKYDLDELEHIFGNARKPDITFFMDVDPEKTYSRRSRHSRKDYGFLVTDFAYCTKEHFLSFQGGIYDNLCLLAKKNAWVRLNGEKKPEEILEDAMNYLLQRLKGKVKYDN